MRCNADRERTSFAPNTATFYAVHIAPVAAATGRTRSLGGLGGRSRIEFIFSSRLSDESMNLTSRRSPLSGLSFLSFSFSEKEKRVGDDAVGNSLSEKRNPTVSLPPEGKVVAQPPDEV